MLRGICTALLVAGAVNWGLVGLFSFDFIAWICGGGLTLPARILYCIVGLSAIVFLLTGLGKKASAKGRAKEQTEDE